MSQGTETATEPFFEAYSTGLCYASVCTNLSNDEATDRLNVENWTGVTPWAISGGNFASGESNPCACTDRADCRHILFEC